jgi:cell shape-determining protein MreC
MEHITIKENHSSVSIDEFRQLKSENRDLQEQITEVIDQITPDEDLFEENRKLSEALNGVLFDNELYQNQMGELKVLLQNMLHN